MLLEDNLIANIIKYDIKNVLCKSIVMGKGLLDL